ncbi:MAG: acyl-CoA dehydrogenase family protein [Cellvibrionales bacterium]|nr:acyl-CoA dehydrogenase family protein [Cellvibrionales bacterium]
MQAYKAPIDEIKFLLFDVLNVQDLQQIDEYAEASEELISAILEEAAKITEGSFAPINYSGDLEECQYDPSTKSVSTPKGFKESYKAFAEGGWVGLTAPTDFGGQGLPQLLKLCTDELATGSNTSLAMYPGLSHGSIDAITEHATPELQEKYLPKLISGEWSGTMCLTEPQCGTDLSMISTKAVPQSDDSYQITGTKIWITGGEHDLTDNILHLVLAKLPDAPDTSKGISLFLVPKFLDDNTRNTAFCGGIEHKMGIKGSSTCVMNFENAKGFLIGKENEGLKCMFTMMNAARLMVGLQGLGSAEAAYQISLGFAKERIQSRAITGAKNPDQKADPIIVHADVRRMLAYQKTFIIGSRAMAYWVGKQLDISLKDPDQQKRDLADDLVQLMTPIVKAYLTDEGYLSIDQGLQLMGGAGFTREWGIEQLARDCRISRIYEGTNGIQSLDLAGRKLLIKGGRLPQTYLSAMEDMLNEGGDAEYIKKAREALKTLEDTLTWIGNNAIQDPEEATQGATPLLKLFALTTLSVFWVKLDHVAKDAQANNPVYSTNFYQSKHKACEHFFRYFYPQIQMHATDIQAGKASIMAWDVNDF